jgi:hypothetical protein
MTFHPFPEDNVKTLLTYRCTNGIISIKKLQHLKKILALSVTI